LLAGHSADDGNHSSCSQCRLKFYEFLGAEQEWINVWSPNVRQCIRVQTYPFNFHGTWALVADTLTNLRSRLKALSKANRRNK